MYFLVNIGEIHNKNDRFFNLSYIKVICKNHSYFFNFIRINTLYLVRSDRNVYFYKYEGF